MRQVAFRCFAVDARITNGFDGVEKAWPPKIPSGFELYCLAKTVTSIKTGMKIVPYCTLHGQITRGDDDCGLENAIVAIRTLSLAARYKEQQTTMDVETKVSADCTQQIGRDQLILRSSLSGEVTNTHAAPFTIRLGRDNLATIRELGNVKNVRHRDD